MLPRGLIAEANKIVRENSRNGSYCLHDTSDKCDKYIYFVYLDGCGAMNPKKRIAYISRQEKDDENEREEIITFECQQCYRTFDKECFLI